MTKAPPTTNARTHAGNPCTTVAFDGISDPGTYVCNWSGHLLRIPEDGVTPGRSPVINMIGNEPLLVTKISDDPYITRTKAKIVASNFDVHVNF